MTRRENFSEKGSVEGRITQGMLASLALTPFNSPKKFAGLFSVIYSTRMMPSNKILYANAVAFHGNGLLVKS